MSNRTYKQDIALDVKPDFYNYSQTIRLNDIYKQSLLKAKCVDFNIPFQHSNNKRGNALNDLRPKDPKLYKNSVKDLLVKFDSKIKKEQTTEKSSLRFKEESLQE